IWGTILVLVLGYVLRKFLVWKKQREQKKLESGSKKVLSPAERFRSRIRKLESQGFHQRREYKTFALELTQIIKNALSDVFKFAAEDLTTEELLLTLEKKQKAFYRRSGEDLKTILAELDQIKFAKVETTADQCLVLLDRSLKIGTVMFEGMP